MSLMSNRIALAPIRDSHLNSPLNERKSKGKIGKGGSKMIGKLSNEKLSSSLTKSFSTSKTLSRNTFPYSPKSISFSDYRSTSSTSSSPQKNDMAGLAATKLKLKLQLALYKLQQNRVSKGEFASSSTQVEEVKNVNSALSTSSSSTSPSTSQTPLLTPSYQTFLPTPQTEPSRTESKYSSSININLQTKSSLLLKKTHPSLSNIASNKQFKKSQRLRLFQIKKNSIFYSSHHDLPLSVNQIKLPKPMIQEHLNINMGHSMDSMSQNMGQSMNSMSQNSFILPYAAAAAAKTPSILINSSNSVYNLPPINKILKTPIKNGNRGLKTDSNSRKLKTPINPSTRNLKTPMKPANSTRSLIINNINLPATTCQSTDDTTIDEDYDATILHTANNTTISKNVNNTPADSKKLDPSKRSHSSNNILTSSPTNNQFGTPNSFSVAKSLLQLGGYNV
jgi:hypothetical protein